MATTITDRLTGLTSGMAIKTPCIAVATSAITLNGLQTIDSVSVAEGQRILVTAQADQTTNGIYVAASGAWTLTGDSDGNYDYVQGTLVSVVSGAVYAGTFWSVTTTGPIVIGSSHLTFQQLNIYSVGTATSTSSVTIGTGSKSFSVTSNPLYTVGQFVLITNTVTPSNYMHGQITAYGSGTLTVNVLDKGGSGTFASWNIYLSSPVGPSGPTGATGPTGPAGTSGGTVVLEHYNGNPAATTKDTSSFKDTSQYAGYLILINNMTVASGSPYLRLSNSGTPITASNYYENGSGFNSGGANLQFSNIAVDHFALCYDDSTPPVQCEILIQAGVNGNMVKRTRFMKLSSESSYAEFYGAGTNDTAGPAWNGLRFYCSGNITQLEYTILGIKIS